MLNNEIIKKGKIKKKKRERGRDCYSDYLSV